MLLLVQLDKEGAMGRRKDGSYATIQAYVSLEHIVRLQEQAEKEMVSVSEIVRRALDHYFLAQNCTASTDSQDAA